MQIYMVSAYKYLLNNTGGIISSHTTYDAAFEKAEVGEYIHSITLDETLEIVSAGKMAKVVR